MQFLADIFLWVIPVGIGIFIIFYVINYAKTPPVTVKATVLACQRDSDGRHYITFEDDNGNRMKLRASAQIFDLTFPGDYGTLTYKQNYVSSFTR